MITIPAVAVDEAVRPSKTSAGEKSMYTGKIYGEIRRVIGFYSNLHRNCDNLNFFEKIIRIVIASRIRKVNNRNRNASEFHLCNLNLNLNPHSILPDSPSLRTTQQRFSFPVNVGGSGNSRQAFPR